jgi:hypothetical protein
MLGPVLDVVCMKAKGMKGQAHVVFRDVVAATTAMRALQNFVFLDKEMVPRCSICGLRLAYSVCSWEERCYCQVGRDISYSGTGG